MLGFKKRDKTKYYYYTYTLRKEGREVGVGYYAGISEEGGAFNVAEAIKFIKEDQPYGVMPIVTYVLEIDSDSYTELIEYTKSLKPGNNRKLLND